MSKHVVKGFITYEKPSYQPKPSISFSMWKPCAKYSPNTVVVAEHSIEVEVPDDFNPVPLQVGMLEAQKKELRLKLAQELILIDEQIANLTCLTNEVTA